VEQPGNPQVILPKKEEERETSCNCEKKGGKKKKKSWGTILLGSYEPLPKKKKAAYAKHHGCERGGKKGKGVNPLAVDLDEKKKKKRLSETIDRLYQNPDTE